MKQLLFVSSFEDIVRISFSHNFTGNSYINQDHLRQVYALFHYVNQNKCTQKKDLIESKKIMCLKDFLWFKEMICLNEIKIF